MGKDRGVYGGLRWSVWVCVWEGGEECMGIS